MTPDFLPFFVDGLSLGHIKPSFAEHLRRFPDVFAVTSDAVSLSPELASLEDRSNAVDKATRALAAEGVIQGWRDEPYAVKPSFLAPPSLLVDRGAAACFGVQAWGVHVNGYVDGGPGEGLLMWVAERSATKPNYPGMLDHLVAGGQPAGLSALENVVKECGEEAGVPAALARGARPVGVVSYAAVRPKGLARETIFCYDLPLPRDFIPVAADGEVARFRRLPLERVAALVSATRAVKPNCNLVLIDFLLRHGHLTPDNCPAYEALAAGLRAPPPGCFAPN